MKMAPETEKIRRFLLGDPGGAGLEDIAMQISDEELDRDIAIAENELIEEYLEGSLSAGDKKLFESHFLDSGDHRELVSELYLLKRYSSGPANAYLTGELRMPVTGMSQYRPIAAAFTIVVIGLLGLLSWMMFAGQDQAPLQQKYVELNSGDLGDLSQYPSMVLVTQDEIQPAREPRFKTNGPGTSFLFRLPLKPEAPAAGGYYASVAVNRSEKFKAGPLKVYNEADTSEVRLLVPREAISPGQASITITPKDGGEAEVYPFLAE